LYPEKSDVNLWPIEVTSKCMKALHQQRRMPEDVSRTFLFGSRKKYWLLEELIQQGEDHAIEYLVHLV